jgi:hypothetical protein
VTQEKRAAPKPREPSWIELVVTIITALPNFAETGIIRIAACFLLFLSPLICMGSAVSWYLWDWRGDLITYSLPFIAAAVAGLAIWMWKESSKIQDIEKIEKLFEPVPERPALPTYVAPEPPRTVSGQIEYQDDDDEGVIDA